jgi:hypothetical protein
MTKRKRTNDREARLLSIVRSRLNGPEERGRPIVLCMSERFLVLYNGELSRLIDVDLKTLKTFSKDIHGSTPSVVNVENLSSTEFVRLVRVLDECIRGREIVERAEEVVGVEHDVAAVLARCQRGC